MHGFPGALSRAAADAVRLRRDTGRRRRPASDCAAGCRGSCRRAARSRAGGTPPRALRHRQPGLQARSPEKARRQNRPRERGRCGHPPAAAALRVTKRLRTFNRLRASESSIEGKRPVKRLNKGVPKMRRVIWLVGMTLALVLSAPGPPATTTISIKRAGFVPASVTINQDDSVTWTNNDTIDHQVVANGGSFASPILKPGKSFTRTFRSGGTFRYHDSLHPALRGTVVVRGAPPQVTLAASAPVVKFGATVTLTGTVSNKKAGETVTLVQLPFGQTTKQVVATLQTTAGGAFAFTVTPQVSTTYQAQWPNRSESSVTVQVQPVIKLPFVSKSGFFHFYVTAATSFAGRTVFLQRFTLARQWVNIRALTLGSKSGRLISVRFVRSIVPRGRWSIRVFMPASEMGGGYLDSWSGTQPVVKR